MSKHHKESLNFGPFPGYYGYMSSQNGYGGLNYSGLVEYMNATFWENVVTYWCDTGYQNVAAATGASSVGWIFEYGTFSSAGSAKETFDLKSFIAASAWSANQEWTLTTYKGATEKGAMNFYTTDAPGSTAQLIKIASSVGSHITSFHIQMDTPGSPGNTCTAGSGIEGYQLAFGDMKIVWNGKIPQESGNAKHVAHHRHASPAPLLAHQASHIAGAAHQADAHHAAAPYHTQLLAIGHDPGALTSQFALPPLEHLGT